jgi:hypothetical protein
MDETQLDQIEAQWLRDGQKLYDQEAIELFRLARLGIELSKPIEHESVMPETECRAI